MMTSSNGNIFCVTGPFCVGNSLVSGEFPAQRPVTQGFGVFFDLRLIKWLSKHSRGWWFEMLSCPLYIITSLSLVHQLTRPSLVQIMAYHMFSTKPLTEPKLTYYELELWEQIWLKSESKFKTSYWKNKFENVNYEIPAILFRHQYVCPDCKVHGENMGSIWGREDPDGPHVGPMNFVI